MRIRLPKAATLNSKLSNLGGQSVNKVPNRRVPIDFTLFLATREEIHLSFIKEEIELPVEESASTALPASFFMVTEPADDLRVLLGCRLYYRGGF